MRFTALFTALLTIVSGGCTPSTQEIPAVGDFDPPRYMGTWYEIARLPQWFEKDLNKVSATYKLKENGVIQVINQGKKAGKAKQANGVAELKSNTEPPRGELRVSFFRPFYSDYRIIELADDYSYAVVTGAKKDALWILSRKPQIAPELLRKLTDKLKKQGFETEKLEYPAPVQ